MSVPPGRETPPNLNFKFAKERSGAKKLNAGYPCCKGPFWNNERERFQGSHDHATSENVAQLRLRRCDVEGLDKPNPRRVASPDIEDFVRQIELGVLHSQR